MYNKIIFAGIFSMGLIACSGSDNFTVPAPGSDADVESGSSDALEETSSSSSSSSGGVSGSSGSLFETGSSSSTSSSGGSSSGSSSSSSGSSSSSSSSSGAPDADVYEVLVDAAPEADTCVPKTCESIFAKYLPKDVVIGFITGSSFESDKTAATVFDMPETGPTNTCPNNDPSCFQKYDDGCGSKVTCENWCVNDGTPTTGLNAGYTFYDGPFCFGAPGKNKLVCSRVINTTVAHDWKCQ